MNAQSKACLGEREQAAVSFTLFPPDGPQLRRAFTATSKTATN